MKLLCVMLFISGLHLAGIFISRDGGGIWSPSSEVISLRDRHGWFLPYSPNAGCIRGFAFAESSPNRDRVYAAVEVGGVLISDDRGKSWRLAEGSDGKPDIYRDLGTMVHPDVHSIAVHPASSGIVTAPRFRGPYHKVLK